MVADLKPRFSPSGSREVRNRGATRFPTSLEANGTSLS